MDWSGIRLGDSWEGSVMETQTRRSTEYELRVLLILLIAGIIGAVVFQGIGGSMIAVVAVGLVIRRWEKKRHLR